MKKVGKMAPEVLRSLVKKPATERYPFVKVTMPPSFRGRINFIPEKCIGCKMCMRDCPSNAITITKVGDKRFEALIALDKCVYCAQCVETCPKKALEVTPDYELASLERKNLKIVIKPKLEAPKPAAEVSASKPAGESNPDAGTKPN